MLTEKSVGVAALFIMHKNTVEIHILQPKGYFRNYYRKTV